MQILPRPSCRAPPDGQRGASVTLGRRAVCSLRVGFSATKGKRASGARFGKSWDDIPERKWKAVPCSRRAPRTPVARGASSGGVADELVELPIFPLPLVLFPGSMLPLQIFEYRYRILMQTLLQTDMRFGIIYSGKDNGLSASIGCVGEVVKYEKLVDDRYFLVCKGQERFRIVDVVRRRPYMVAKVEWLEDRPSDQSQDLNGLSDSVEALLKDVIRLSNKMKGSGESATVPDVRRSAFPTPFSFWVASMFESAPNEQQALLELTDTVSRLQREQETLKNTLNYLTAAAAVKEAFPDE